METKNQRNMIIFSMQDAWWKTTETNWALVCHYKKASKHPIDLTDIATKLPCAPINLMRGMLCYQTEAWSRKRWRKTYQKIPQHIQHLLEKRISSFRKTPFEPFLIRRIKRS